MTVTEQGFSIIEFILIIIIVSIISLVGIMAIKSPSDTVIDLAARKVAYDMGFIRERAMASSKTHKIYINIPDRFRAGFGNYTLITNPENNSPFDLRISKNYPGVTFFKNYSVQFDPLGRGKFVNVTSITLESASKSKNIKIVPYTGKIYVQ